MLPRLFMLTKEKAATSGLPIFEVPLKLVQAPIGVLGDERRFIGLGGPFRTPNTRPTCSPPRAAGCVRPTKDTINRSLLPRPAPTLDRFGQWRL